MYASVRIPLHSATNVLTISGAGDPVHGGRPGRCPHRECSETPREARSEARLQTAAEVEVLSGLSEGDTVVFGEQNQFKEGQLVSPKLVEAPRIE